MTDDSKPAFVARPVDGRSGCHELVLQGRVYADAAPALRAELERADAKGARTLLVDASRLEQIDAVALRTFVDLLKRLRGRGGAIAFFGLAPVIERTFGLIGLDKVVHVAPTRADALGHVAP